MTLGRIFIIIPRPPLKPVFVPDHPAGNLVGYLYHIQGIIGNHLGETDRNVLNFWFVVQVLHGIPVPITPLVTGKLLISFVQPGMPV